MMWKNRILLLCAAIVFASAVNAFAQSPAQAKAVSEACSRWLKPLDRFQVISDDNYDKAIMVWKQVSGLLPQRIDSLATATGLSFHETYKLVEAQYMNHPFMAKKAAYQRLKGKEWSESSDMDLAIVDSYMLGATIETKKAMVAEIWFAAKDYSDVTAILYDYYAPIHKAYNELLAKGVQKDLLDDYRQRCFRELDSVARKAPLSPDVDKRINNIVKQRLQSVAAQVATFTTLKELEEYRKSLPQLENEIVNSESAGHSSVWSNHLSHALTKQCDNLLQARHEALWCDLIVRMNDVARPVVQNFAKAVSKAHDHDEYCKIYYDYSQKMNKGGELYNLLLKNGFSKEDINRYRQEYIKELNQY